MNDGDVVEIEDKDVVVILRPEYDNGEWTGEINILQTDSGQEADKGMKAAALTAIMMVMLPSYLNYRPEFKSEFMSFLVEKHPEALEAFMSRHIFDKE